MIDIQCSPLEDDSLSLNAQYVFSCNNWVIYNKTSIVEDQAAEHILCIQTQAIK